MHRDHHLLDPYWPSENFLQSFSNPNMVYEFWFPLFSCKFYSKDNTVWPILSFREFFITYHQKFMLYFCFKHPLKTESGTTRVGWPILPFWKNLIHFYKKHIWFNRRCVFSTFLANSDQEALPFDPYRPFKDLIYFPLKYLWNFPSFQGSYTIPPPKAHISLAFKIF